MREKTKRSVRVVMAAVAILVLVMTAAVYAHDGAVSGDTGVVVGEGLSGPQGVLVDEEGNVWAIDAGVGGEEDVDFFNTQSMEEISALSGDTTQVVKITPDGEQSVIANLRSLLMGMEAVGGGRLALLNGVLYATVGQGAGDADWEGLPNFGGVVSITEDGVNMVASTWDFERANNPDGTTLFDSHPYGLTAGPDGYLYVADSGANDVLRIDPETGEVELVAVLDPLPGVFPNPLRGGEMLADPVPTAIVFDEAGNLYVSYLSGAPFIPGSSGVKMITPEGEVSDYATGFTMLTDLRRGPDGNLYGVQFGVFTEEGPQPASGSVVHIKGGEEFDVVIDGLTFATSVDFNQDGDAFVTVGGLGAPGSGTVLKFEGVAAAGDMDHEDEMANAADMADVMAFMELFSHMMDVREPDCTGLPSHAELTDALKAVVAGADNGGFGLNMWATTVNRDGEVCAVTFSGADRGAQWPGSRVISAQKANTANAFSLPGLALSTANLYTAVQSGNSLFGLQFSNPVDTQIAYAGPAAEFGQETDPMVGERIGGVNVFGGGLALYDADGTLLGAVGVSGDASCTDHIIAWKVRDLLGLDYVPGGISETGDDNIVFAADNGWAHPACGLGEVEISAALVVDYPIGE